MKGVSESVWGRVCGAERRACTDRFDPIVTLRRTLGRSVFPAIAVQTSDQLIN